MKKQILTLILGILIGAIITTGIFLCLKGNDLGNGTRGEKMNREDFPAPMDGNNVDENGEIIRNKRNTGNSTETETTPTTENTTSNS